MLRPWTAYLADTLADEPMRLGREERQELVGYLSGEGLSRAAIATAVDVPERTIQRDFRAIEKAQVETDVSPSKPVKVTGLDGKTYTRPTTSEPTVRRAPLIDQFDRAVVELNRDDVPAKGTFRSLASKDGHPDRTGLV